MNRKLRNFTLNNMVYSKKVEKVKLAYHIFHILQLYDMIVHLNYPYFTLFVNMPFHLLSSASISLYLLYSYSSLKHLELFLLLQSFVLYWRTTRFPFLHVLHILFFSIFLKWVPYFPAYKTECIRWLPTFTVKL